MRVAIYYEGIPSTDGRYIEPGALTFPESVPVTVAVRGSDLLQLIGTAANFRREEDGSISADFDLSPQIEVKNATWLADSEDHSIVTSGELCSVFLSRHPAWRFPS